MLKKEQSIKTTKIMDRKDVMIRILEDSKERCIV
jgi:hypothetical protein